MFFSQILIDIVNQTAVEFCGKMHHYVSSPFMAHFCTFLGTSLLSLLQLFMGQYPPKMILFVFPEDSLGQKRGNKSNSCGTCYTYAKGVTPPPSPVPTPRPPSAARPRDHSTIGMIAKYDGRFSESCSYVFVVSYDGLSEYTI